MLFENIVNYLTPINENIHFGIQQKVIEIVGELAHHQDRIANLFRKINHSNYNDAPPKVIQKLETQLKSYIIEYKDFVNNHMDVILSDETLKRKYHDFAHNYSKALKR